MAQVVDQMIQNGGVNETYMTPVNGIENNPQKGSVKDYNAIGDTEFDFQDYGLKLSSSVFDPNSVYYLHARIKRMSSVQDYDIKLISSDPEKNMTQQIKRISIANAVAEVGQKIREYVDVEFLFTPLDNFDIIVFELKRDASDVINMEGQIILGRDPAIAFIELSTVENKKPALKPLKKIGLQSHPDLLFCINKEEFHLPRSGVFELRDGIVDIVFFSVVSAAKLQNETGVLEPQMEQDQTINLTNAEKEPRVIDAFMLDFMYNDNKGD